MSEETEMPLIGHKEEDKFSVDRLMSISFFKQIMRDIFYGCSIVDGEVKRGSKTSANIYVNKRFEGKRVTIIVWDAYKNN